MANPSTAEDRIQPQSWNRNPAQRIRRHLKAADSIDEDIKGHVTMWLQALVDLMGDDPRQRALVSIAGSIYTECVRAQSALLQNKAGSKAHERANSSLIRNSAALAKILRMAALKGKGSSNSKSGRTGEVFTPPRGASASELEAEGLTDEGDDAGEESA